MTPKIDTLMIIDDSEIDLMLAARVAERSGQVATILRFQYAEKALDHIRSGVSPQPSLILLDINMPRMDGFEFLEALEGHLGPTFASVVVMLTTSMNPDDEERAESHPYVRDFRNKPLSEEMILELCNLYAVAA
ncbi:MAG: response regulator [Paracoccaceae bacterium]|nr:response regulator [Paracoccaceae bacterium]